MEMTFRLLLLAPGLLVFLAGEATASAQELVEPEQRQGFFLALGARSSLGGTDHDETGSLGASAGGEGELRVGQMVTQRVGLGLAVSGGVSRSQSFRSTGGGLLLEAQVEPSSALDLAVRGGVGLGVRSLARRDQEMVREDDPSGIFGSLYSLGVSHDWFVRSSEVGSGGLALTTAMDVRLLVGDGILDAAMLAGIELTYWGGLERHQLALPVSQAF